MSHEEMLEMVRDLERLPAGLVRIERTERQPYPFEDLWQIVCWCDNPRMHYTIKNAGRFREVVHAGLTPVLPRGALGRMSG
ncbi:MAG TPA: hypothetical protein VF120_14295 [Ktedonobacterales bacterium]